MDRLCGNCSFGADAYDRNGDVDPQYVICQIKEAENRQRKPDRFQTTSAVSRMHVQRESCLHWRPEPTKWVGESPLPMQEATAAYAQAATLDTPPDNIYDQMYGGTSRSAPAEPDDWQPETYGPPTGQPFIPGQLPHQAPHQAPPAYQPPAQGYQAPHVATAENEAEIKRLRFQLMQAEQMVVSLQTQQLLLSEELTQLKQDYERDKRKLEQLKLFDVALFAEVNYFSLLGVPENASSDQIKDAYRTRMKVLHPDRFVNISQRLNVAYETLMDAEKKRKYLQQIKGRPHA